MVQFSRIIVAYFIVGAVLWGGGLLPYSESGITTLFVSSPDNGTEINNGTAGQLEDAAGPIQEAAESIGGGAVLAVFNLLTAFIGFLFWPTTALIHMNAPPRAIVLGSALTVAFFGSVLRVIRSSA